MKPKLLLLLILVFVTVGAKAQDQPVKHSLLWQGEEREYYLYIPSSGIDDGDTLPVMIFLHGFDGGIDVYHRKIDFQAAADDFRWIIALPQALTATCELMGADIPVGKAWNSGVVMSLFGTSFSPNSDVDDAGFLMALGDTLMATHHSDPDSLFFVGFSMGSFMTYRMAIEYGERINGIAAASGLIPLCYADTVPAAPVNVLHIHGTDDTFISPDGTASPIPGMGRMALGLSVDSTVLYWRNVDQCGESAVARIYDNTVEDGLLFTLYTYSGGVGDTRVAFLSVDGGEHKWYEDGHDVQYMRVVHDFFTRNNSYTLGGIDRTMQSKVMKVYPNPAENSVVVVSACNDLLTVCRVDGHVVATLPLSMGDNLVDIGGYPAGLYILFTATGQTVSLLVK